MMQHLRRLVCDRTGAAAAELALVTPLLILVMASRYGGRLPLSNYDCSTGTVSLSAQTQMQKIARTGTPDGSNGRLGGWTADNMTNVSLTCLTSTGLSYVNKGVYAEFPSGHVPVVTVTATVPHPTLFGVMTIASSAAGNCGAGQSASWSCLKLFAKSQSAVFGA
jgi:hypothetical protein